MLDVANSRSWTLRNDISVIACKAELCKYKCEQIESIFHDLSVEMDLLESPY